MSIEKTNIKKIIQEDYDRKVKKFEQISEQGKSILIGDSMVAYLNLKKFGLDHQIINQGIAGDTSIGVLKRLHLVYRLNPSVVIISVGSNDMVLTDLTLDQSVENIIKIRDEIEDNTKASVYIMSLTPVLRESTITNKEYVSTRTNQDIQYINRQLKSRVSAQEFINVYDELLDHDHHLALDYTTDGIHLNHEGYEIYTKYIIEVIR